MRRSVRRALALACVAAGCTGAAGERETSGAAAAGSASVVPATFERYEPGAVSGGPGGGQRYGLGVSASPSAIARWDSDIGPDGAELPPGQGSVAEGKALYDRMCASCHGVGGVGGIPPNPALVGRDSAAEGFRFARDPKLDKTIGNYWPYATTVFDYIKRAMPQATPGILTDPQVYALTAYILSANQILPGDATLDAAALRQVKMPYRDRFVPDDRTGGAGVR
jgi:cytochrome c